MLTTIGARATSAWECVPCTPGVVVIKREGELHMRMDWKSSRLELYIRNEKLVQGLHQLGMSRMRDLIECPFKRLLSNELVLNNWNALTAVIGSLTHLIRKED